MFYVFFILHNAYVLEYGLIRKGITPYEEMTKNPLESLENAIFYQKKPYPLDPLFFLTKSHYFQDFYEDFG